MPTKSWIQTVNELDLDSAPAMNEDRVAESLKFDDAQRYADLRIIGYADLLELAGVEHQDPIPVPIFEMGQKNANRT